MKPEFRATPALPADSRPPAADTHPPTSKPESGNGVASAFIPTPHPEPPRVTRATFARAVSWTSGATAFSHGLAFVRSIVLARLLQPDDFGLFALAVAFLTVAQMLTELSLYQKILIKSFPDSTDARLYLDTVWTAELIRRVLLSLFLILSAYPASLYFRDSRLALTLGLIGLVPILGGLQNPGLVHLRRILDFRTISIQSQVPAALALLLTVAVAYLTRSYIALVCSLLFETLFALLLSYYLCTHRPRFTLNKNIFLECLHFGKYLFFMALMTSVTTQLDQFVIGRYLGPATLGFYALAQRLATLPLNIISGVINSVLLPAYGQLNSQQPERLPSVFVRVSVVSAIIVLAISGVMALLATPLVVTLYGRKWEPAASVLSVLAIAGMFRSLSHTLSPLLLATNRPALDAQLKVIDTVVFTALLFVLVPRHGAIGAGFAAVLSYSTAYVLRLYFSAGLLPAGVWGVRLRLVRPLLFGGSIFSLALLARVSLPSDFFAAAIYLVGLLGATAASEPELRAEAQASVRHHLGRIVAGWQ